MPYNAVELDFERLLHTNELPSDLQLLELQRRRAKEDLSVLQFNKRIAETEALLIELKTHRDAHSLRATQYSSVLSVIRRIPADVLIDIFRLLPKPLHGVFPVAQVCSRWRSVAINTPYLWTTVIVDSQSRWDSRGSQYARRMILERAASIPITLNVFSRRDLLGLSNPLYTTIPPICHRIRQLTLSTPFNPLLELLITQPKMMTCLESICVRTHGANRTIAASLTKDRAYTFFTIAPRLRDFRLDFENNPVALYRPLIDGFPWHQLSNVIFNSQTTEVSVTFALRMLSMCVCLEACTIQVADTDFPDFTDIPTTIALPNLHSLYIRMEGDRQTMEDFFNPLSLPRLQCLDISSECTEWNHDVFMALQRRSSFKLIHLSVTHVYMDSSHLVQFLQESPSLQYLNVDDAFHHLRRDLLTRLTFKGGNALLPNLLYLSLVVPDAYRAATVGIEHQDVIDVLESRTTRLDDSSMGRVAKLTYFNFRCTGVRSVWYSSRQ